MDMTCRCNPHYTCVACKTKRGDYKDWMLVEREQCATCGVIMRDLSYRRCYACRHAKVKVPA